MRVVCFTPRIWAWIVAVGGGVLFGVLETLVGRGLVSFLACLCFLGFGVWRCEVVSLRICVLSLGSVVRAGPEAI